LTSTRKRCSIVVTTNFNGVAKLSQVINHNNTLAMKNGNVSTPRKMSCSKLQWMWKKLLQRPFRSSHHSRVIRNSTFDPCSYLNPTKQRIGVTNNQWLKCPPSTSTSILTSFTAVESRNDGRLMHTMDKKFLIHTIVNISTIHWMSSSQKVNISTT
jgi:hypothetical protein